MPITYGAKIDAFKEYSDGVRIGGGLKFRPAPYLPILWYDKKVNKGVVIKKGTIVALDANNYIVPANGGVEQTITYGSLDIQEGVVDIDNWSDYLAGSKTYEESVVTTAGDATAKLAANYPIGVAQYDIFQWDLNNDPWYQIQPQVAILEDRFVLFALDSTYASYTYTPGTWVAPDGNGWPVPIDLDTGLNADDISNATNINMAAVLNQLVGRVIRVVDLSDADADMVAGFNYVTPVPGLGLPGSETNGYSDGIDTTTGKGVLIQLQF